MTQLALNDVYINLFLAMALGMAIGMERFIAHKTAGMRTYTLVSMGSALFVIISRIVTAQYGLAAYDFHMVAQIVAAVGFLGVGAILHTTQEKVVGITTASGLWVAAGIGMACGFGLYRLAMLVTGLVIFTFVVLWFIEEQVRRLPFQRDSDNNSL